MVKVRTHKDCPDDGKIYWPIKGAKEFCVNCKHFMPEWFDTCKVTWCMVAWPESAVCAKYERRTKK